MKKMVLCFLMALVGLTVFSGCSVEPDRYSYWKSGTKNEIVAEISVDYGVFSMAVSTTIEGYPFMILEFDPVSLEPIHVAFGFHTASDEVACTDSMGLCATMNLEDYATDFPDNDDLVERFSKLNIVNPVFILVDADVTTFSAVSGGFEFSVEDVTGTYHFSYTASEMVGELIPDPEMAVAYSSEEDALRMEWQFSDPDLE